MEASQASINDLAKVCAHTADAAEWEELLRRCTPLTGMVAARVCRLWTHGSSPAMVDDIVQEIFMRLCEQERRILREFEPRGEDSFLALLRVVAASVANDYFRRISSVKRGGKVVTASLETDAQLAGAAGASESARIERSALLAQLDRKLGSVPAIVSERDRWIFWLYYRQGLTAEEIAGLPDAGLTPKGVESALRRTANWLKSEVGKAHSES